jgi:alpha-tubulin suppressor-like RCC1 family protein
LTARNVLVLTAALHAVACTADVDVIGKSTGEPGPRDSGAADVGSPDTAHPDTGLPEPDTGAPDVGVPPDVGPPPGDLLLAQIAAADTDTCGVTLDGDLYCWGQLPDGHVTLVPERVAGAAAGVWQSVTGGAKSHCALRRDGSVHCFGGNDEGQLGQGDTEPRATPVRVALPSAARSVRGRYASFCATLVDGSLYCWGASEEGQTAQDDPFDAPAPDRLSPTHVQNERDWTFADVGQGHGCGIRGNGSSGGELYCWGRNSDGELGLGDGAPGQLRVPQLAQVPTNWLAVAAGQSGTCGLRTPGALYCFGSGSIAALGLGGGIHATPTQVETAEDWTSIDLDTFHTCGIRAPGALYCWGRNDEGQLGQGDTTDRSTPTRVGDFSDWTQISVGRFHSCGLRRGGSVWCAGANDDGRVGTGDEDRRSFFAEVARPAR